MITSLSPGGLPSVRVVISGTDAPIGVAWTVTGSYMEAWRTVTYRPRGGSGVGTGDQIVLTDAAAPIRVPVTYTLSTGATSTITRPAPASDLMVSMLGSSWVAFERTARGGDQRTPETRAWFSDVPGSRLPPVRMAPTMGAGTVQIGAVTDVHDTWGMRDMLATNRPVYMLHSCDMPDCDIPHVELAVITSAPSTRATAGQPGREWSLTFRPVADPEPSSIIPVAVWDDLDSAGLTWASLDALTSTWDAFDLTDWDTL